MATDSQNEREFDNIILELNKNGLAFLTQRKSAFYLVKFTDAFIYFKQAEKVIEAELKINQDDPQLNKFAGITYNNLACYYKKYQPLYIEFLSPKYLSFIWKRHWKWKYLRLKIGHQLQAHISIFVLYILI